MLFHSNNFIIGTPFRGIGTEQYCAFFIGQI